MQDQAEEIYKDEEKRPALKNLTMIMTINTSVCVYSHPWDKRKCPSVGV